MFFIYGFLILLGLGCLAMLGIVVYATVNNIVLWHKNNKSPKLTETVSVASKRTKVNHKSTSASINAVSSFYLVTFEYENGEQAEFYVQSEIFTSIEVGDRGKLTFQGTRFISFEKEEAEE